MGSVRHAPCWRSGGWGHTQPAACLPGLFEGYSDSHRMLLNVISWNTAHTDVQLTMPRQRMHVLIICQWNTESGLCFFLSSIRTSTHSIDREGDSGRPSQHPHRHADTGTRFRRRSCSFLEGGIGIAQGEATADYCRCAKNRSLLPRGDTAPIGSTCMASLDVEREC
jgi:hypothetical protein